MSSSGPVRFGWTPDLEEHSRRCSALADGAAAAVAAAQQRWLVLAADALRFDLLQIAMVGPATVEAFGFTADYEYLGHGHTALCASLYATVASESVVDVEDDIAHLNPPVEVLAFLMGVEDPLQGGKMTVEQLLKWTVTYERVAVEEGIVTVIGRQGD